MADAKIIRFWMQKTPIWPEDRQGHTFLLNAVHAFGKKMFGSDWSGLEPIADHVPIGLVKEVSGIEARTSIESATLLQKVKAYQALRKLDETLVPTLSKEVFNGVVPFPLSSEQWERALDETASIDKKDQASFRRFALVMKALARAMGDGTIRTVVRRIPGGAYERLAPEIWNTEHYPSRFAFGQIDLKAPYGEGVCDAQFPAGQTHTTSDLYKSHHDFRFVLVNIEDLQTAVDAIPPVLANTTTTTNHVAVATKSRERTPSRKEYLVNVALWFLTEGGGINSAISDDMSVTAYRRQLADHMNKTYRGNYTERTGNVREYVKEAHARYQANERIDSEPAFPKSSGS